MLRYSILLAVASLVAQADQAATAKIDAIMAAWNRPDAPGAAVAVIHRGAVVFQKGYGSANLEYATPISPETVFHVASVSKQFTAMSLVLLEQDGKLSLDDDVRKYLPELPDYGTPITIKQLLQHTSGIRDQWQTLALAGWRLDDVITQAQILRMLFRQAELNFVPGSEFLYSNGGYSLAAEIAARVSGKSFPQLCEERIFRPLGMTRTHVHDDHRRIVPNRAYSYGNGSVFQALPMNFANAGATSLFTTAPDLARWLDNFRQPKVGNQAAIDRLQEQGILSDGRKNAYALGISVGTLGGLKTLSHSGGDAGYRSAVVWFPGEQLGIAVVANVAPFDAMATANRIAAVYLNDRVEPPAPRQSAEPASSSTTELTADELAGTYRMSNGAVIEVERRGADLFAGLQGQGKNPLQLRALNRFVVGRINADAEFVRLDSGDVMLKLTLGGKVVEGRRARPDAIEARDFPQYAGQYWSEELETRYTIRIKDGKFFADHARHGEIPLSSIGKDRLGSGPWFMSEIAFTRDESGRVTGFIAGGGRVKGIRFAKQ